MRFCAGMTDAEQAEDAVDNPDWNGCGNPCTHRGESVVIDGEAIWLWYCDQHWRDLRKSDMPGSAD